VRRIDVDSLLELVRLHRLKTGARKVAELLRLSPNTEREYRHAFAKEGLLQGSPEVEALPSLEQLTAAILKHKPPKPVPQAISSVEPHRARIVELAEKGLECRAIHDRLRLEEEDFAGSYHAVRRMVQSIKAGKAIEADDVVIPVETAAGEIAQVDFGEVCQLYDPETKRLRRAWVFVMVLAFSRRVAARIVYDQTIETWLRCHVECFAELGGVPKVVVPDNLKSAVTRAAFGLAGEVVLNRSYRELARHYGFKIDPTPPRDPKKKGKVESGVRYVKRNFFTGRHGQDASEVTKELARWVTNIANTRTHGRTQRRPIDLFVAIEQGELLPLPRLSFEPVRWAKATVHRDTHIAFDRHLYSVPWQLVGKEVFVRATRHSVEVHFEDTRVARHDRGVAGGRTTLPEHLPAMRGELRHRDRGYWEERASKIGPESAGYIREVFDSDDVLYQIKAVQAIVLELAALPPERAEAASRRARFYASYSVGALRAMLRKGLELEPLPTIAPIVTGALDQPRFARDVKELLQHHTNDHEVDDEPN
jgi:transposase